MGERSGTARVTIAVRADMEQRLLRLAEHHRVELRRAWHADAETRKRDGVPPGRARAAARAAVAAVRADRWPTLDTLVERAVRQRLTEPDLRELAGPLDDPAEEAELRLAGRWPGSGTENYHGQIAVTLPADLIDAGRRAAWRTSRPTILRLRELRTTCPRREYLQRRAEATGSVLTWADIVRQALDRYVTG